jgi:ribonuclease HI
VGASPTPILPEVIVYTDGACIPNPGAGGCAAVLTSPEFPGEAEFVRSCASATNNQMELAAVWLALSELNRPCRVHVFTDSQNVIGWMSKGWKRNEARVQMLCQRIDELVRRYQEYLGRQEQPRG